MRARSLLVTGAILLLSGPEGQAQSACGPDGRYHLRPAPEILVAPAPTPGDLDAGEVDAGVMSVTIIPRGNASRDWELCLRALGPTMGTGGKPVSDVEFWTPGSGGWTPTTPTDQVIARGRGRSDLEIRFRVRVGWHDDPGAYDAILALTLAAG